MSFDGNGVYSLPVTTVSPAVDATTVDASDMNALTADLETALSLCLTEDGQNVPTGNLPMATYRHTGVGDGAALTDYVSVNQLVDGAITYGGASAAGTDTYAASLAVNPVALVDGARYSFKADVANTGACTINFNAIGAKSIKLQDSNDPYDNAILANQRVVVEYDGTNCILINPHTTAFTGEVTSTVVELNMLDGSTSGTALTTGDMIGAATPIDELLTFTPTLTFGSGTASWTAAGTAYRVGELVWVSGKITFTSLGTAAGAITLNGLPETVRTTGETVDSQMLHITFSDATTGQLGFFRLDRSATTGVLYLASSAAAPNVGAVADVTDIGAATDIWFGGVYRRE